MNKSSTFKLGTGLFLVYHATRKMYLRLYCDYDFASPGLDIRPEELLGRRRRQPEVRSYSKRTPMHNFTFGVSIAFMFLKHESRCTFYLFYYFRPSEMIDQATIDRILDAAQIVVVSRVCPLRRRGELYRTMPVPQ